MGLESPSTDAYVGGRRTVTSLTLLSALLVVLGAFTRLGYPRALALAGATSAGAALELTGRIVVPTFFAVAIGAVAASVLLSPYSGTSGRSVRPIPGMLPLVLFALWTTCITAAGALIFGGTPVLNSAGEVVSLGRGGLINVSNVAQLVYLWIGIAVVVVVARSSTTGVGVIGLGLTVAVLLNTWSLLNRDFGVPFPLGFFDNSPNFRFIDSAAGGVERFRGIMAEPSSVAGIAIPALVFAIAYLPQSSGWRRVGTWILAGLALWIGLISTSTSFIVAGLAMIGVALLVFLVRFVARHMRVGPLAWVGGSLAGVVLAFVMPRFMNFLAIVIGKKFESASYADRSGADQFSFDLALDTFGLGVGLGSNRPSSFVAALLSQTGVLGFVLYVVAVLVMMRAASRFHAARPALWVMLSLLIGKVFNGPDLGDTTGLTWLTLGVLAHAALQRCENPERPVDVVHPVVPPPSMRPSSQREIQV